MRRILLLASALAFAGPAHSQVVQFPVPMGRSEVAPGYTEMCFNSQGVSVPQALCDMYASTIQGSRAATAADRALVVTMSPNSSGPNALPSNTTTIVAVGSGTTGAVTATMAAVAGRRNVVCGFSVTATGGTATVGPITLATLAGSTTMTFTLASSVAGSGLNQNFQPCIPASAANTAITMTTTADGTASAVTVNLWGYLQ